MVLFLLLPASSAAEGGPTTQGQTSSPHVSHYVDARQDLHVDAGHGPRERGQPGDSAVPAISTSQPAMHFTTAGNGTQPSAADPIEAGAVAPRVQSAMSVPPAPAAGASREQCDPDAELMPWLDYKPSGKAPWIVDFKEMQHQMLRLNPGLNPHLVQALVRENVAVYVTDQVTRRVTRLGFSELRDQVWRSVLIEYNQCTEKIFARVKPHKLRRAGESTRKTKKAISAVTVPAAWILGGPAAGFAASI